MKTRFLMIVCLLCSLLTTATWAQGTCYLLDTNGQAMATLTKVSDNVYEADVTFESEYQFFYVAKRLNDSEDNWWAGNWNSGRVLYVGEPLAMNQGISEYGNIPFRVIKGGTYQTTVDFGKKTILIEDIDDQEVPDIDPSTGAHFILNLSQPGTLKQRLTSAVLETDYDLVDFLTVKGKMNSEDLKYIHDQEGLVSQLQYLDLSDVELVYDNQPYYSVYVAGLPGSSSTSITYYLSAENRVEKTSNLIQMMNYTNIYRNNLAQAFSDMKYLKQCKLPKTLEGIGEGILQGCPLNKVTLPTAPTYIWGEAFAGTQLKAINLPATVEFIGDRAFDGAPISSVDVSHVTSLGKYCFASTSLKTIQLNGQITEIPEGMFNGCKKLAEITIPTSVKIIGANAFGGSVLTSVTIPESVTEIGASAFNTCVKLQTVTMGNGVRKIGEEAFSGCDNLATVMVSNNLEEIGYNAFGSIPWTENLPVEDGVIYISKVAYQHVTGSTVKIKEGVVSLADEFGNAGNISSITLPSTLRILGDKALQGTSISSIELPESLEKIGSYAFSGCNKLRRIAIPQNVKYFGQSAFNGTAIMRVYYNAVEADVWEQDNDGVYSQIFPESVSRVIIGEGVKVIPHALFMGCENLARVTMASTVEYIGNEAFNTWGSSLLSIDLPSSLKYLGGGNSFSSLNTVTAYMKEPFPLSGRPSEEEILNDEEVRLYIAQGEAYDGVAVGYTPFGGLYYPYHIDEQGNLTWGEPSKKYPSYHDIEKQDIILRVPNGSLAAYQADPTWVCNFKEIVTFDGASDMETIAESTTVSVSQSVTEETDLSGTMVGGIYVTLDTEDSGDGYDATEGCFVINSLTTAEGITAASADDADDLTIKNQLQGLVFEVSAGKGKVTVDCQTLGSRVLYVKAGTQAPKKVVLATRGTMDVDYNVTESTRVFIYAANDTPTASNADRHAVYANDGSVKFFGLTITVDDDAEGISSVKAGGTVLKDGKFVERDRVVIKKNGVKYNASGQRVE